MPVLLFVLGATFAVLTAISHFPPQRFGTLALAGWFVGWLVGELPVHHLILQTALVIWAIAGGGLDAPIGWAGLGLAALSVAGLVLLAALVWRPPFPLQAPVAGTVPLSGGTGP